MGSTRERSRYLSWVHRAEGGGTVSKLSRIACPVLEFACLGSVPWSVDTLQEVALIQLHCPAEVYSYSSTTRLWSSVAVVAATGRWEVEPLCTM
jgi:hypothetical protein